MPQFDKKAFIDQLSIDCVIFGYQHKVLKVLISKIDFEGELWTVPGGFILKNESTNDAAKRILEERTGLKDIYLEQFKVFGDADRSNKEVFANLPKSKVITLANSNFTSDDIQWLTKRFVSIGYYALVDINNVKPQKGGLESKIDWVDLKAVPPLIIDHNKMVSEALDVLRLNLDRKLIGFNLLPKTFTMREVKELYEAIYDKEFARNNFQKKILNLNVLERLEKKYTGAANKAPYLYQFMKL